MPVAASRTVTLPEWSAHITAPRPTDATAAGVAPRSVAQSGAQLTPGIGDGEPARQAAPKRTAWVPYDQYTLSPTMA